MKTCIRLAALSASLLAAGAAQGAFTFVTNVAPDSGAALVDATYDQTAFNALSGTTPFFVEEFNPADTGIPAGEYLGGPIAFEYFTVESSLLDPGTITEGLRVTDQSISQSQPFDDFYLFDQNDDPTATTFTFKYAQEAVGLYFRDAVDLDKDEENVLEVLVNGTEYLRFEGQKTTGTLIFLGIHATDGMAINSLTFIDNKDRDGIGYDRVAMSTVPEPSSIIAGIAVLFIGFTQRKRILGLVRR